MNREPPEGLLRHTARRRASIRARARAPPMFVLSVVGQFNMFVVWEPSWGDGAMVGWERTMLQKSPFQPFQELLGSYFEHVLPLVHITSLA